MKNINKVFSGIDNLPKGDAPDSIVPGCIVLEGGAFRGVYSEGVLDAFMEAGLNFQCTIGVSAGALNGHNYVGGHIGRAARVNLKFRHDPRYVGKDAIKKNSGIIGFDFAFKEYNKTEPFNIDRFKNPARRFVAVATNCITGKPVYFEKGKCRNIVKAVRASATMPYVSKPVMIDGIPYLDGGCSVKVPYQWALDEGFKKIIVVRTRVREYRRKESSGSNKLAGMLYHKYPEFAESLRTSNSRSNMECDEMDNLEKEGKIFVIAPSKYMKISRIEGDMEKLGDYYYLGYNDGKNVLDKLKKYLEK